MIRWVNVAVTSTDKRLFVGVDRTWSTLTTATWKIRHWIYVYSMLKNGHQVDRYLSTSTLRREVSVRIWYIFQRRFNHQISLSTRTVDSSTSNIRQFHVDASPTAFVDFSTLSARWFNVDISQSIRPVDSSTLNIRRLHVEVSRR